jgi:integrase
MSGTVKKEANGTWFFVVDLGTNPNGTRNQKRRRGFQTRKEADKALTNLKSEHQNGLFVEPSKVTLGEFLEQWIAGHKGAVAPKTWQEYDKKMRGHLIPHLGGILIQKLKPIHIKPVYTHLLEDGKLNGEGGLAPKTVREIHTILKMALDEAIVLELIKSNPSAKMKLPKVEQKEKQILTKDECATLLTELEGNWLHSVVAVAMTTGARLGEVLALKWKNVDLDEGTLQIVQSVEEVKGNRRLKEVKTKHGRRKISLAPYTVEILHQRKVEQAEMQLKLGIGRADLVFTNYDGSMRSPHLVSTEFPKVIKKLDITPITFHGLRHTHASLLLLDGHPIKAVSSRLGHAKVSITLDIYTHCLPDSQEKMVTAYGMELEAALEQAQNNGRK